MKRIKVVCGIIWKKNTVFIARRKLGKHLAGYWEFPGGKVELNETHEESLLRELNEELGMSVEIGMHYMTVLHNYESFRIELISYECIFQKANFIMSDHDNFEWVDTSEIDKWKLAPADLPIANKLRFQRTPKSINR